MAVPVEITAGVVVRSASAALFVLFGLVVAILAPRSSERALSRGLALFGIGFGGAFIINNLGLADAPAYALATTAANVVMWGLSILGLALVLWALRPRAPRAFALVLGLLFAWVISVLLALYADPRNVLDPANVHPPAERLYLAGQAGQRIVAAMLAACALAIGLRVGREPGPASARAMSLVAAGLALWPAFAQSINLLSAPTTSYGWLARVVTTAILFAGCVVWLRAVQQGAGRGALLVALAIPAAMLFAVTTTAFGSREFVIEYRNGVVRTIAVAALALAVFRHDLLGTSLRTRTARRASGATIGLASLFIVAQVAQTYFSASGGLVVGGAVAGALLFAASSVQRKIEASPSSAKETSFRSAVRMALKDGHITREEERHLVVLADHLGIRPARAYELRDDEERARGAK